jgi:S-adenosylmethionine hydrolase
MAPRSSRNPPVRSEARPPIVTLLTDFGTQDVYVGIMKGVILAINPHACLIDLTHEVGPQDVTAGAWLLRSAVPHFPTGTIHLAVVDPGVGCKRRGLVVATREAYLVGPDNGLLSPAAGALGVRSVHAIDVPGLVKKRVLGHSISQTFHGRDVFAPIAARLSLGDSPRMFGKRLAGMVTLGLPASIRRAGSLMGQVIHSDRFGNLITNLAGGEIEKLRRQTLTAGFSHPEVSVSIGGATIPRLASAYAAASNGELLAIMGSWDLLEIAVRGGNAAERLAVGRGAPVKVTMKSER